MFAPYTPLDQCIGKEVKVRAGGESLVGMLTGVYALNGQTVLVITPMQESGAEQHVPLAHAVVTVRQG